MADIFSSEKRSEVMCKIRGKWTKPERRIHNHLKGRRIRHKMHPKIYGNPDILLKDSDTLVFIDGCFWHGCPVCKKGMPSTNKNFWKNKIRNNKKRDKKVSRKLRIEGWKLIRIWEHETKDMNTALEKMGI